MNETVIRDKSTLHLSVQLTLMEDQARALYEFSSFNYEDILKVLAGGLSSRFNDGGELAEGMKNAVVALRFLKRHIDIFDKARKMFEESR